MVRTSSNQFWADTTTPGGAGATPFRQAIPLRSIVCLNGGLGLRSLLQTKIYTTRSDAGGAYESGLGLTLQSGGKIVVAVNVPRGVTGLGDFGLLRYAGESAPVVSATSASGLTVSAAGLEGTANPDENPGWDAPGIRELTFEVSGSEGEFIASIPATPATAAGKTPTIIKAKLSELSPETEYRYRIRGIAAGGVAVTGNELTFTTLTIHQDWRRVHFGSPDNTGDGADAADPDIDGLPNLLEWAAGSDPKAFSAAPVTLSRAGGGAEGSLLEFTYTRSVSAVQAGALFAVEWTDDPAAGPWSAAGVTESVSSNDGTVQRVRAVLPAGDGPRRFVRLKVTVP